MARKRRKHNNPKTMTLGEIGFSMKIEAARVEGDTMHISKKLWLELAEVFMITDKNLLEMQQLVDEIIDGMKMEGVNGEG